MIVVVGIFQSFILILIKQFLSNMCMLLTIGFIMLARLKFANSIRQFVIVAVVTMLSPIVPYLMSKYELEIIYMDLLLG